MEALSAHRMPIVPLQARSSLIKHSLLGHLTLLLRLQAEMGQEQVPGPASRSASEWPGQIIPFIVVALIWVRTDYSKGIFALKELDFKINKKTETKRVALKWRDALRGVKQKPWGRERRKGKLRHTKDRPLELLLFFGMAMESWMICNFLHWSCVGKFFMLPYSLGHPYNKLIVQINLHNFAL